MDETILKLCGGHGGESVASNILFVMMDALFFFFFSRVLQSLISEVGVRLVLRSLYARILPDLPFFHRLPSAYRMSGTATQTVSQWLAD
jgi:hypothetical protein